MDCYNWDASQLEILDNYGEHECISVLGACGTGKSAVLEEIACREMSAGKTIAFLVNDRRAAKDARMRIVRKNGVVAAPNIVSSLSAFCRSIVQEFAEQTGRERPEWISGAQQDARLRDIINSGVVSFPSFLDEDALSLPAFRNELRNLITCAGDLGLTPEELRNFGMKYEQPLWKLTADLWSKYLENIASEEASASSAHSPLSSAQRLDHSQSIPVAVNLLKNWYDEASTSNISIKAIRRPQWDYVFIDDLHNAPRSVTELIDQLYHSGTRIICAGNPDSSVQGFRGAVFSLPLDICKAPPAGIQARPYVLAQHHRGGKKIAQAMADIAGHIRQPALTKDFRQLRMANPECADDVLIGKSFANETEEAAGIAGLLRGWHLRDGIAYSDMAVMTRSRSAHEEIRQELRRRNVPVATIGSQRSLAQQDAVAGLINLIDLALDRENKTCLDEVHKADKVRTVLSSPLFALSPFDIDVLSQRLYSYEHMRDGQVNKENILAVLVDDVPVGDSGLDIADRFNSIIAAIVKTISAGNSAEQVLWTAWEKCEVAEKWQSQALSDSEYREVAHDNLDAVIQLFTFVEREVDSASGISIAEIIEILKNQEISHDSSAGSNRGEDSVVLVTPASAQGREFSHLVIARLNEGVWPNLTVRDALVRTGELSDIVLGRHLHELWPSLRYRAQMPDVLDDELRQLYAGLGRASHSVVLTCVSNSQSRPSRFFDAMGFIREEDYSATAQAHGTDGENSARELFVLEQCSGGASRFDMTGLVGQLRRYAHGEGQVAQRAQQSLKKLADEGVMQAEPAQWFDSYEPTSCEGRTGTIPVSPSRVEETLTCPLRGIMQGLGFDDKSDREAADIGTIIHAIAAEYKDGGAEESMSEDELCQKMLESFQEQSRVAFGEAKSAWKEKEKETYAMAVERLAHFFYERAHSDEYNNVEAEYSLDFDEAGGHIRGSIDRLEIGENASYIYDYKTGKKVPTQLEAQNNVQLQIYQLAIARDTDIPNATGAKLVYPNTKNKKASEVAQNVFDEDKVKERIGTYVDYEKSAIVPAQRNAKCERCAYSVLCPLNARGRIFS